MSEAPSLPRTIASQAEADALVSEIKETMEALLAVLSAETRLVRANKLREAARLGPDKTRLVKAYADGTAALKANAQALRALVPERIERLKQRHDLFREDLRLNMAVLSTAKAVSENLLKGLAEELGARDAPQGYGAAAPAAPRTRPLAVNRAL